MKKQTDIAKKQYQGLDKIYEFDKKENEETKNTDKKEESATTKKNSVKSNLFYSSKFTFYKYRKN